jgi:hypothetical protein
MALQTTASVGLSDEMKTFYDRQLLTRTVPLLVHAKFGQKKTIPTGLPPRRWSKVPSSRT